MITLTDEQRRDLAGIPLTEKQINHTFYKWEFLRRNKGYRRDWKKLKSELTEKYKNWRPFKIKIDELTPLEKEFCLRWKILKPFCPDYDYDYYTSYNVDHELLEVSFPLGLHLSMFWILHPEFFTPEIPVQEVGNHGLLNAGLIFMNSKTKELADKGIVTLQINLNFSKKRLKDEFSDFLDRWISFYEKALWCHTVDKICRDRNLASPDENQNVKKEFNRLFEQERRRRKRKYRSKLH